MTGPDIDPDLAALADAYGVATGYEDYAHRPVPVAAATVVAVLAALGVPADGRAAVRAALTLVDLAPWRRLLPPSVVVRREAPGEVLLHAPAAGTPTVEIQLEDGGRRSLSVAAARRHRAVDGVELAEWPVRLPAELPLGWHRLRATASGPPGTPARTEEVLLVVTPSRLSLPRGVGRQAWGWMVQLYSLRSGRSWGMGDLADLAELADWSGADLGAGVLLCNPLHAVAPVRPIENSPYFPSSRRFWNPLYLRIEAVPEYAALEEPARARLDALGQPGRAADRDDRIDRDAVWRAKLPALELLFGARRDPDRAAQLAAFRDRAGAGLADFALWCALAERHGRPWQDWPADLAHPRAPAVAAARAELADRVEFFSWLQFLCDEQLAAAQAAAVGAGMPVGLMHDLAVGVDPGGADAWALQDTLALAVTVGAPPDSFNQQGQDWSLPPWRPDRLAAAGYAPYRDMLRSILRHAGGIRIDHILGLFRLWWIPAGESAAAGTYVRYDDAALLGVLALEAHRAGAVVVGEDLGTVEDRVATSLCDRGILGSAVLWFERETDPVTGAERGLLPPERWRELALASVTTHDLPTAAGFLRGEHVRVRAELGQLGRPVAAEQAQADRDRAELLAALTDAGLVGPDPAEAEIVLAMHALLGRTPCRLVLAAPADAVGDRRQPNLPGTVDEYPNWRLPTADGAGRPQLIEDLRADPRVAALAAAVRSGRVPAGAPAPPGR